MATTMAVAPEVPRSLSNLFAPPNGTDVCVRCQQRVYLVEKVGPINEVVFHKQCFKCSQCNQHLALKTYFTNRENVNDKEVYCSAHCPKYSSHGLDAHAVGIKQAMRSQAAGKGYNDPLRGAGPRFGHDAMFIAHPVDAQKNYQKKGESGISAHHFPAYLSRVQDKIYKAQEELERRQREDEDRLMSALMQEREKERVNVQREVEQEWELNLKDLTDRYEHDMTKKNKKDTKALTVRYESEKNKIKTDMTSKIQQKREAMTVRLRSGEQEQTSSMVQKHSKEMLELLKQEQEKIKQEIKNEIASDSASEELAVLDDAMAAIALPAELPSPHAPRCRKRDLYYDPVVFKELDEDVFRVAESDQATFTDLVRDLTENCLSDLQKARAIFRWITVKDLNVIEFDDAGDTDTPMGLLRGIKFGTETYHTLFMRLCSYAGLACVEIKGHSKSVGYEPGMKIREDTFQNTWNAVLIDGDWWPVQCNWGARHLVLNKDQQTAQVPKTKDKKQDKIRYQYDEHYFLTDPDEFIQEFWAQERKWQLLDSHVTLEDFESMPFVRSVFFQYGLEFDKPMKAVLHTDNKGGTEVKVRVPVEFIQDLVFHYQIRFSDRERRHETEFKGAKLERFVFHSLHDGAALFSVHVPAPSAYFLEIFANKIDDSSKIGDDPNATMMPFRLKCACKYKIVCEELVGKMHPLPNCASGEWGPSKGSRHFGLKPLTHTTGVVNVDNDTEIRFKLPRPLHFLCKLRMNGLEDHQMEKYVKHTVLDNMLTVRVLPPNTGQYGIDIYARPEGAIDNHTLAHACKYLLNVTRVNDPVELSVSKPPASPPEPSSPKMAKDKWGPSPAFDEMKLRTITHKEPIIETSSPELVVELGLSEQLKMSFQFLREPDEDAREKVTFKDKGDRVKFLIRLGRPGNYLLAVYARRKKDSDSNMFNIYNYMIRYSPDDSSLSRKKEKQKGLFRK